MKLKAIHLKNIRGFRELAWSPGATATGAGWNVILGDNGSGKSTFLRAAALTLVGPGEAAALRQDWSTWLRHGARSGTMHVVAQRDATWDALSGSGAPPKNWHPNVGLRLIRETDTVVSVSTASVQIAPERTLWGGARGWFSAAYGPYRRFAGGDKDLEKLYYSRPRLARHLSVFGESVALTECLEWLRELRFRQLERPKGPDAKLIEALKSFVNQPGFLPEGARLSSIDSKGVKFVDAAGRILPVDELSDGYRSVLSMTFELIRQLVSTYGAESVFEAGDTIRVVTPGVVLIDEVDAHLHPTWQRRIGRWFTTRFPNVQFIVTTHSPLVCQAAHRGSVFLLARPGSDETSRLLVGDELNRVVYGSVLDAYASGAFGEGLTRSEEGQQKLERLALLNRKDLDQGLTDDETREQHTLRSMFPTSASLLNRLLPGGGS